MSAYVYFKGSVLPEATFDNLHKATEYMERGKLTGVVVIVYDRNTPELIWYNQGHRR